MFNLNNTSGTDHLIVGECWINNSDNVGLIKGFLRLDMFEIEYDNNNNGITYESITHMALSNITLYDTNKGTQEKFVGTFEIIQKQGGFNQVLAANSATAIDVTGVVNITNKASISETVFSGNGTYVNGTFSKYWYVRAYGIPTESDEVATGNFYVSTTASTIIATVNTPVKVAGTTTSVNLYRVTSPANNRLTYTGTKTRYFKASGSLTAIATSNNQVFSFYIAKNGTILPESKQTFKLTNNTDQNSLTISCTVSLAVNDYIEVWVTNNTSSSDVTIPTLNLAID